MAVQSASIRFRRLLRHPAALLLVAATLLVGLTAAANHLWQGLGPGTDAPQSRLVLVVASHVAAGAVYLVVVYVLSQLVGASSVRATLMLVLLTGVLMRAAMLPSAPGWEDDYYRYLWDGAVVHSGGNAYEYSPKSVQRASETGTDGHELLALADEAGPVLKRINHPHLRTIYPPLAQGAFALAHQIGPWSFNAWRLVILLHDTVALVLLAGLLRSLGQPLVWSGVYWLNPLLVKEFYQSAHMDALVLPWVLGGVWLAVHHRTVVGAVLIACATAVKVWPALLLPLLVRRSSDRPARALATVLLFGVASTALMMPMLTYEGTPDSGLARYTEAWQNNAGFFALHMAAWERVLPWFGFEAWHASRSARWTTAAFIGVLVVTLAWPPIRQPRDLTRRALWIIAAVFLIGPTQFPWYSTWLVPFLAVCPFRALLLYTTLLPLYHLQELSPWVLFAQHTPVWAALLYDMYKGRTPMFFGASQEPALATGTDTHPRRLEQP